MRVNDDKLGVFTGKIDLNFLWLCFLLRGYVNILAVFKIGRAAWRQLWRFLRMARVEATQGQAAGGAILRYGKKEKELSGSEDHTTNNRMELLAAIEALSSLTRPCQVELTSDSEYLRKGVTEWAPKWKKQGWKTAQKKEVKNIDLWHALLDAAERHQVKWHWVKGHSGHPENERADALANFAIDKMLKKS